MNTMILAALDRNTRMLENFGGVEYKDLTNIHPAGLAAVLILGIVTLILPRRWAVLPMLLIACFIPAVQKIVILGMDFNLLRIMIVFGVVRLFLKREYFTFVWKPIDKIMICWVISSVVIYTLQQGNFSALVNRLGVAFDAFGMYFLFRCLIRDWSDVDTTIFSCLLISIPVMAAFLIENRTGRNMFSVFGGVDEITVVREGRLRCQGAFSHAILAGCFWASLIPLFAVRWWKSGREKAWAVIGVVNSCIIVFCCASSTPVLGVLSAVIGALFFPLRRQMRFVRWSILLSLITLHMVMQAPVWHLISRVSAVGGSTSWYRYNLINETINHFGEWWLLGTRSTLHWGLFDIPCEYALEGIRGGLLTLMLRVGIIVLAFRGVGRLWRSERNVYRVAISWALGVSLFVHCMSFIAVAYFGQIYIVWYFLLAVIGSMETTSIGFSRNSINMKRCSV